MKRYGLIPIDQKDMNIYEREILILLYRYSNFNTNITGYTVSQLVASSDKVLGLTTQKVRTILKNLEKKVNVCYNIFNIWTCISINLFTILFSIYIRQ